MLAVGRVEALRRDIRAAVDGAVVGDDVDRIHDAIGLVVDERIDISEPPSRDVHNGLGPMICFADGKAPRVGE